MIGWYKCCSIQHIAAISTSCTTQSINLFINLIQIIMKLNGQTINGVRKFTRERNVFDTDGKQVMGEDGKASVETRLLYAIHTDKRGDGTEEQPVIITANQLNNATGISDSKADLAGSATDYDLLLTGGKIDVEWFNKGDKLFNGTECNDDGVIVNTFKVTPPAIAQTMAWASQHGVPYVAGVDYSSKLKLAA